MSRGPELPEARGEVSAGVLEALRAGANAGAWPDARAVNGAEPFGDDLQLALYTLYELHYRGFDGVDDAREWDPAALRVRVAAEERFLAALRAGTRERSAATAPRTAVERSAAATALDAALDALLVEPVGEAPGSVSHFLRREGLRWQLREYAAVRSVYHLKEADPHAWVLPRLTGRAKAAMVAIEFDEFGGGHAERAHARLFAELMEDLGLDAGYGRQLDAAPAPALAVVNLMSLFGLRRALRGALVGHFAAVEITSSPGSRRLAEALRRVGAGPAAERFYEEHVEADAVHEQLVRREVVAGLVEDAPELAADVVFGIEATGLVEDALAGHLLDAWRGGRSALRRPAPGADRPGLTARAVVA
ncbi:Iron-containing redox enzyme [Streptomyces zhaozhouensis]|uniref:Iron-containing redox enzyme n=1 Tax=Streptomyces zhaozhouensis TaxID=1300267 RepID=A0A286DWY6_9ACTN|nr:iron-containing redox enzyme family protein [Streptomyces zhaozhouensis]SOD63146.1 Iron-containing redox enzyme [Streptomyces zhaozhouensis]